MKAVRIHEFGSEDVLRYEDVPEPALRKDHVLVRIRACALNHLDLWVRKGLPGVPLPHILGSDIAGEVLSRGGVCFLRRCISAITVSTAPQAGRTSVPNSPCSAIAWMEAIAN